MLRTVLLPVVLFTEKSSQTILALFKMLGLISKFLLLLVVFGLSITDQNVRSFNVKIRPTLVKSRTGCSLLCDEDAQNGTVSAVDDALCQVLMEAIGGTDVILEGQ